MCAEEQQSHRGTATRLAGLAAPIFALRSQSGGLGIGDTAAVREAIDFCTELGLGWLQVLPIHETGGDHSPYNALSAFALDPALLEMTPQSVPGLTEALLEKIAPPELRAAFEGDAEVDYSAVKAVKRALLEAAHQNWRSDPSPQEATAFEYFEQQHADWLRDYALFRALVEFHDGNADFEAWPDEYHDAARVRERWHAQELSPGIVAYVDFFVWVQWVAHEQWRSVRAHAQARGVRLLGDVPFGVARTSADVWARPELFDLTWSGGAPPEPAFGADEFTRRWGQNWGIPLYNWNAHAAEGFAWWRRRIAQETEVFSGLRIDHVLGFFRIYAFPWRPEQNDAHLSLSWEEAAERHAGRTPSFQPNGDDIVETAAENDRQGTAILETIFGAARDAGGLIVAEDLGCVPDYVRPALLRLGFLRLVMPFFERDGVTHEINSISTLPEPALAAYTTHDHPALRAQYEHLAARLANPEDMDARQELGRWMRFIGWNPHLPPATWTPELHRALMARLLESPCAVAVLQANDLLGTTHHFNEPGRAVNWTVRLNRPLDDELEDPARAPLWEWLREQLRTAGRMHAL